LAVYFEPGCGNPGTPDTTGKDTNNPLGSRRVSGDKKVRIDPKERGPATNVVIAMCEQNLPTCLVNTSDAFVLEAHTANALKFLSVQSCNANCELQYDASVEWAMLSLQPFGMHRCIHTQSVPYVDVEGFWQALYG
jgi:hypothetical protein